MITFEDRARGAMLGHALGDAYGRPLEFTQGEAVRVKPAGPGHDFMWTDDTHMGLYLGMATLDHGPGALDADRFGACVGAQFSAWLDDPLTPSTAPGHTCMAGAHRWRVGRDWRTSGVVSSDGCGAVMGSLLFRLLVAIALRGGLNPNDLKLITALFVLLALTGPTMLRRIRESRRTNEERG